LAAGFDSVSICLSKGLGAPVGSVLAGSRDFISRARRNRKVVGGGMRQAGILAAAGLAALTDGVAGLAEDHRHAAQLADGLSRLPGLQVAAVRQRTNMVMVDVEAPSGLWVRHLKEADVLINAVGPNRLRLVTHLDVSGPDVERTLGVFAQLAPEAAQWS
ncbi:MAG: threonine aldolase family protein, partial [Sulfobacillus sp.]